MNSTLQLSAYHESAKVTMAYLSGYFCEKIELSSVDSGGGSSRLNAGEDTPIIQTILGAQYKVLHDAVLPNFISVAYKLLRIYCAGSCAVAFFESEGQINQGNNVEIGGKDARNIEMIAQFLSKFDPNFNNDTIGRFIAQLFTDFKNPTVWKPIEMLSKQLMKAEGAPFNQFQIEDALMMGGLRRQRSNTNAINLKEEQQASEPLANLFEDTESKLDKSLQEFLKLLKSNITEDEIKVSINYLKSLFTQNLRKV
ncbi:MAG: hypothetical protein ACK5P4_12060 [Bacteroidota bacterium]|jgi:hypothetical protein